jgi:hypothetical protein
MLKTVRIMIERKKCDEIKLFTITTKIISEYKNGIGILTITRSSGKN